MSLIQGTSKPSTGGYEIEYAARLGTDHSFLKATTDFVGTGNSNYYTVSFWAKRCGVSTNDMVLHSSSVGGSTYYSDYPVINASADKLVHYYGTNASAFTAHTSSAVFRDPTAWTHWCIKNDNGVLTYYANNEVVLTFTHGGSYRYLIANSYDYRINTHEYQSTPNGIGDWYIADYYLILDSAFGASDIYGPDQFGEYNNDGVWVPKANTLTTAQFGEDGCFMEFKQSGTSGATASDIGADTSGNDNHMRLVGSWTSNDQVTDTPTANSCTMNILDRGGPSGNVTLSDGSLVVTANGGASNQNCRGTFAMTTGKWYWEMAYTSGGSVNQRMRIGISDNTTPIYYGHSTRVAYIDGYSGNAYYQDASQSVVDSGTYVTFGNGDHMMFAFDADAGKLWFGKNGTWMGSPAGDPAAGTGASLESIPIGERWQPLCSPWVSNQGTFYFLEDTWTYTAPTGFNALSTKNLGQASIKDGSAYFQTTLFTGTGAVDLEVNQSENSTFQPDFVWAKQRNKTDNHILVDAVRAAPNTLYSNQTAAEVVGTGGITSLDPDGFTVSGDGSVWNNINQSGITVAAWQWLAGNGTASNTDGDFTSTVSANQTSGFSALTWTGDGTSTVVNSIGHGLGKAPSLIIMRRRSPADDWMVYAEPITESYYLRLNATNGKTSDTGNNTWGGTAPTSSVFYTEAIGSAAYDYVAYCFAEIDGFSKFGTYTGNGSSSDGPYISLGFTPALVICKAISTTGDWVIRDDKRLGYNPETPTLAANSTAQEYSTATGYEVDLLANGFKIRNLGSGTNSNNEVYLFAAWASHPGGGSNVAPATAR